MPRAFAAPKQHQPGDVLRAWLIDWGHAGLRNPIARAADANATRLATALNTPALAYRDFDSSAFVSQVFSFSKA